MFSLDNKNVLVIGLGKTGISLIKHIKKQYPSAKIIATDSKPIEKISEEFKPLINMVNSLTLGGHKKDDFDNADIIFVSPGVDLSKILYAPSFSKEIINDIELAFRTFNKNFIAITGSNGKSTTTKLVYEMINTDDNTACLCGNYGNPILDEFNKNINLYTFVCELSSFQLENISEFSPGIILFLNLSEDHLDRYPSYEAYIRAKENIFLNTTCETKIIYNLDDPLVSEIVKKYPGDKYSFSWSKKGDAYVENTTVNVKNGKIGEHFFNLSSCRLKGRHHFENIMAATLAALLYGTNDEKIQNIIDNFTGIPHRNEFVRSISGISFYNDSKATNIGATLKAIESFEKNILLILGGKDKGGDLSLLKDSVKKRVKVLLLIGEAQKRFYDEFHLVTNCINCFNFEEAVLKSRDLAESGDTVLLSPACSSYDMFNNYEERGDLFKSIVWGFK